MIWVWVPKEGICAFLIAQITVKDYISEIIFNNKFKTNLLLRSTDDANVAVKLDVEKGINYIELVRERVTNVIEKFNKNKSNWK